MTCLIAAVFAASLTAGPQSVFEQDLHGVDAVLLGTVADDIPEGVLVRKGYHLTVATDEIDEARFMQIGDEGVLYVSQPRQNRIVSLKDADDDGTYETQAVFVDEPGSNPHSMDFNDGWLYFTASEPGYLKRARDTNGDGKADETQTLIAPGRANGIPSGGGHPFRGVLVDTDNDRILITVSDPSNMTRELESDRKTLYAFAFTGDSTAGERSVFATGIRNTEKIRHRIARDGTETQEVWGADHGSDNLGSRYGEERGGEGGQPITDLNPPDELNHLEEGKFYGHPYLMADRTPRPEYLDRDDLIELAAKTEPAAWSFGAHTACNGFTFADQSVADTFGPEFVGDLFQAQHGSWNSSVPVGYSVNRVLFDEATGRPYGELKIVDAHPGEDRPLLRPVDLVIAPDGTLLFSCDMTHRIYRLSPQGE